MKKSKRIISLLLSSMIALSALSINTFALDYYSGGNVMKSKSSNCSYYVINDKKYDLDDAIVKRNDNNYYYRDGEKVTKIGWVNTSGKKIYVKSKTGKLATGLTKIDGNYYYFTNKGILKTDCWKTINGKQYYLTSDGHAATNEYLKIDGVNYWFRGDKSHVKCANKWAPPDYGVSCTVESLIKNTGFDSVKLTDNGFTATATGASGQKIYVVVLTGYENKPVFFSMEYKQTYNEWSKTHSFLLTMDDLEIEYISGTTCYKTGNYLYSYDYDTNYMEISWMLNQ